MRNCLTCVLTVLVALFLTTVHAMAQTDAEKSIMDRLLANEAAAGDKVRAYDRLHQKVADIHALRGQALEKEGNKEEAAKAVHRANAELMLARQIYELALQRYPANAGLHNYYGELLFDRFDEQDKGVEEWRKAIKLDEKLGRAHNNLGICLCHEGEYVDGLEHLDKAVMLEPDNPDYQYNLAQIYLAHWPQTMKIRKWTTGELYEAAMKASKAAARLAPKDFDLVVDYARNFYVAEQMGITPDWENAAAAWQSARKLVRTEDEKFNAWLNEGRVWYKAGKGGKAARCCEEALKIRPESLVAKELMSMAREPNPIRTGK